MIPVNEPALTERDLELVSDCVRTGWVSSAGKYIEQFEQGWAEYCGRTQGIAVSNGSTALEIAVRCAGIGPGDEVIMPTFTIVSCANAVVEVGAIPVLVDAEPRTWCMDVGQVAAKITAKTKAIMPVHIYGHPVDMDPLLGLAEKHGLAIIEDAAEVHGAEYLSHRDTPHAVWRRCGSFGTMSTFSFFANKLITTGEGGMIVTSDAGVAARARSLRNLCFLPERRFLHHEMGFNFRLTNVQAAMGVAQLERFPSIVARKREVAARYTSGLGDIAGIQLPVEEPWARSVYWMYGLVLDDSRGYDAFELARRLREAGVDTRPFFLGMHSQPVFQEMGLFRNETYPVSDRISQYGLYLPSGLALADDAVDRVIDIVHQVLG
jgi:perosamine synthetase